MAFWTYGNAATAEPAVAVDPVAGKTEVRNAYDRGRLDERSRHRGGFGLAGFILAVAALLAVGFIVLAIQEGSFAAAGAAIDAKFAQMTGQVAPAANTVAARTDTAANTVATSTNSAVNAIATSTGTAMPDAGESLKENGAALKRQTPPASH
jgi:hypothetical protein